MDLSTQVAHLEARLIREAISESPTRRDAAARLGISLRTLFYKTRRYGMTGLTGPRVAPELVANPEFQAGVAAAAEEVGRLPLREDVREFVAGALRGANYSR